MDNYNVHFKSNISGFHRNAEKIVIENNETKEYENRANIFIEDIESKTYIYNFELRCEMPGTFFRGSTFFKDYIVISLENYVYLYNTSSKKSVMHKLNGYFDNFYPEEDFILIGTDTHLMKINNKAEILWRSEKLGVEKIAIKKIENDTIIGSGNWGQPKSWQNFTISLKNGQLAMNVKQKNSGFFANFKKVFTQAIATLV